MSSTSLSSEAAGLKARTVARPWQFFLTASLIAAAAAVWFAPPASPVALLFLSLAIAAAGASATALHMMLSALAGRSAPETGVSGSVRETLEREKFLVLRSIKDLEFDRAMGKMSAADAAPLEARLRARAIAIMRELDGRESVRARVEADLARQLAQGSALRTQDAPGAVSGEPVCAGCGTANDPDAAFCKRCGAKL